MEKRNSTNIIIPCCNFELVDASTQHEDCFSKWRAREEVFMDLPLGFESMLGAKRYLS